MKIISLYSRALFVMAFFFAFASSSFAGFWEWSTPYQGPKKDIITLIITANYLKPVVIAQLIRNETRQPFISVPQKGHNKIFFRPAGKNNPALEIREKNLARFIRFLHPQQVIVLGDKRYVPQKYLDAIDKNITTVIIKNDNWVQSALTLQKLLRLNNLYRDFKRFNEKFEQGLYRPTPREKSGIAPQSAPAAENADITITPDTPVAKSEDADNTATAPAANSVTVVPAQDKVAEPVIKVPPKAGPVLIEE